MFYFLGFCHIMYFPYTILNNFHCSPTLTSFPSFYGVASFVRAAREGFTDNHAAKARGDPKGRFRVLPNINVSAAFPDTFRKLQNHRIRSRSIPNVQSNAVAST